MRLSIKRLADIDLDDQFDYLEKEAGLEVALRFLESAEGTFAELLAQPEVGALCQCQFDAPQLSGARRWRIKNFEQHLVFYRVTEEALEIVRVIYGGRDLERIFNESED